MEEEEGSGRVEPEAGVEWSGDEEESDRDDVNRREPGLALWD